MWLQMLKAGTILLTKITATQNEVALNYYHRVRGLYFLADIFARLRFLNTRDI